MPLHKLSNPWVICVCLNMVVNCYLLSGFPSADSEAAEPLKPSVPEISLWVLPR